MSVTVRRSGEHAGDTAALQHSKLRLDLLKLKAGSVFHADATTAITLADAADLPTVVALANSVKALYNAHLASACDATTGVGAHLAADATNPVATADATDQGTANTLLNAIKTAYAAHRVLTSSHPTADGTNTISAANATDLGTSITLANSLKAVLSAHFAAAFGSQAIALVNP